jgi:hypothetical protein
MLGKYSRNNLNLLTTKRLIFQDPHAAEVDDSDWRRHLLAGYCFLGVNLKWVASYFVVTFKICQFPLNQATGLAKAF